MKKLASMLVAVIGFGLASSGVFAAVQSESVSYTDGETALTGHVYWDDSIDGKRPGVLERDESAV